MTLSQLEIAIVNAIRSALSSSIRQIFLFGSRATETNLNPRADIDIGIVAAKPLSGEETARIQDAIDAIDTLLKIDIVDFTNRNDEFTDEAKQHMRVLYESTQAN